MEEQDLYDEFGNYLGPLDDGADRNVANIEEGAEEEEEEEEEEGSYFDVEKQRRIPPPPASVTSMDRDMLEVVAATQNAVVLHEDKQYYPSAETLYGKDVDIQVQEEDTQLLTEPIVEPVKIKQFQLVEDEFKEELPFTLFSKTYFPPLSLSTVMCAFIVICNK